MNLKFLMSILLIVIKDTPSISVTLEEKIHEYDEKFKKYKLKKASK